MSMWNEDAAFWAEFRACLDDRLARTELEAEQVTTLLALAPPARILDLPCGVGRHSIALARRGYAMTGVDITPAYIDIARRRAAEIPGLRSEFRVGDMREHEGDGSFDAVINIWTSFGYFKDIQDDRRVAGNLLRSLRPGGVLLMEMMGKEVFAMRRQAKDWQELGDGSILLTENRVTDSWSWISSRWTWVREGKTTSHMVEHRLYSFVELRDVLASVGFAEIRAFGSLGGTPYDLEAMRLVVRAKRPG